MKNSLLTFVVVLLCAGFHTLGFAEEPKSSAGPDTPPSYWTVEKQAEGLGVDLDKAFPDSFVTVVYFHRVPSCAACQMMARSVFSVLKDSFPEDIKARKINLKYVNFEAKENRPVIEMFGIKKPTVILLESSPDGVRCRRASRIWELSGNEAAFKAYILKEVNDFIEAGKSAATESKSNK